jgi:hypothetical protein
MALETLKGVPTIGGYHVIVMDELRDKFPDKFPDGRMDYAWFEKEIRPYNFIYLRNDVNSIAFTIQNGPIKENGVNGCQVDTLLYAAKAIIEGLDAKFPCEENAQCVSHLKAALDWLDQRTKKREARGVEGTSLR